MNDYRVIRSKTSSAWTFENPYLKTTELGIETNTGRVKVGIGERWSNTTYVGPTVVSGVFQSQDTSDPPVLYNLTFTNGILASIALANP